jgi:rhodanese-related sulfurtransferase
MTEQRMRVHRRRFGSRLRTGLVVAAALCAAARFESVAAAARTIEPDELARLREAGEQLLLIDVRPAQQYDTGHLEGAMNVPAFGLRHPRLPAGARIVVYDGGEGTGEAEEAWAALDAQRHDVRLLSGGLLRWESLDRPVVRPPGTQPLRLVRWITPAQLSRLLEQERPDIAVLDVREGDAFARGRIPRARRSSPQDIVRDMSQKSAPRIVVVYGDGGESDLEAAERLRRAGFRAVRVLYGGFPNWEARGQEVAR